MKSNLSQQPSINQDNPHKPVYIVNLSTLHRLLTVSEILDNFAQLHYNYAKSWLHFEWYSKAWVTLKYLSMTRSMKNYNLGKIDTETFINQLQAIFNFLPREESAELLKQTWNSLIIWDNSAENLHYLIEQQQPICLVSNTNELNIQKIKEDINNSTHTTWNWQQHTLGECHFQVCEPFRLMTSYDNKLFKWDRDGLIKKLVDQLLIEGYTHENMTLVSRYQFDLDNAKTLGIKSQSADQFFPAVPVEIASQTTDPITASPTLRTLTQSHRSPRPDKLSITSRQSEQRFFEKGPSDECPTSSETSPLLRKTSK